MIKTHNLTTLKSASKKLAKSHPALGRIHVALGTPPLWNRDPGFATLVHMILEQQVSLASARSAFDKLNAACIPLTPEKFLRFSDQELKAVGFSRQKTRYCRTLAQAVIASELDLSGLASKNDESVRETLTAMTGIGIWTANIYLLMVLLRTDVWPRGDIALQTAWQRLNGLETRPTANELEIIAQSWAPQRAVAARLLWHYYLSGMPVLTPPAP